MEKPKQKYIHIYQQKEKIRCRIKRILCIISVDGKRFIYEVLKDKERTIVVLECSYSFAEITAAITDPHFYPTFKGVLFNTRFYRSCDTDRNIKTTEVNAPKLVVARDAMRGFVEHTKYW